MVSEVLVIRGVNVAIFTFRLDHCREKEDPQLKRKCGYDHDDNNASKWETVSLWKEKSRSTKQASGDTNKHIPSQMFAF
jgi:hypothetical protein